jgi:hypothetical protein
VARTTYRQFKREAATHTSRRRFQTHDSADKIVELMEAVRTRPQQAPQASATLDYSTFKDSLASAIGEIKLEIQSQHEHTRLEVQTGTSKVVSAVKASPAAYVKTVCEFGALFLVLTLILRFALHIELVNPAFAVFALAALAVYWTMAHLKQKSDDGNSRQP